MNVTHPYHLLLGWVLMALGFYGGVASANSFNLAFLIALFVAFCGGFFVAQPE